MEAETNNAIQGTEIDGTIVELCQEVDSITDRQVKGHFDSSNYVVKSASQFHDS
jgi:hypothetical protein